MENENISLSIEDFKKGRFFVNWAANKVPLNSETLFNAKPNDPNTWSTFEKAKANVNANKAKGVGFMFAELPEGFANLPKGYVLTGIDIDAHKKDENGEDQRNPYADEILNKFRDTYIEKSPSGTGYHILFLANYDDILSLSSEKFKGKWDTDHYYMKNAQKELECYMAGTTKRYFTFSENAINIEPSGDGIIETPVSKGQTPKPLNDETQVFKEFLKDYMVNPNYEKNKEAREKRETQLRQSQSRQIHCENLSDEQVLDKMFNSKYGDNIKALFNGDTSRYGNDDSSADIALCHQLAFWTGGDFDAIDRIFRMSALMRDKWERNDYRTNTINKAIASQTSFYTGNYYKNQSYTQQKQELPKQEPVQPVRELTEEEKKEIARTERIERASMLLQNYTKFVPYDKKGNDILINSLFNPTLKYFEHIKCASVNDVVQKSLKEDAMRISDNILNNMAEFKIAATETAFKNAEKHAMAYKDLLKTISKEKSCSLQDAEKYVSLPDEIMSQINEYKEVCVYKQFVTALAKFTELEPQENGKDTQHEPFLKALSHLCNEYYAIMYDNRNYSPTYYQAMDIGDNYINENSDFMVLYSWSKPFFDVVSSDRETAALGYALNEMGVIDAPELKGLTTKNFMAEKQEPSTSKEVKKTKSKNQTNSEHCD